MSTILEHNAEASPGLPAPLPGGERTVWQGRPDWKVLARTKFHLNKLALYFGALLVVHQIVQLRDGVPLATGLTGGLGFALLAAFALGLIAWFARATARSTLFTVTNRRVVIRCGVALPLSVNLPFSRVDSADLRDLGNGYGDIALRPTPENRASYTLLWPYVRPWRVARVQPMLRALPEAGAVAEKLAQALEADAADRAARPAPVDESPEADVEIADEPRRWTAYPTVPLAAATGLVAISVLATAWVSFSGSGPAVEMPTNVVASVELRFEDRTDGSIDVVDASNDRVIDTIESGENGFLRSTLRGLARARKAEGGSAELPFALFRTDEGRLLLVDPVSAAQVDLWAFGSTNAGTFVRFLASANEFPAPDTAATGQDDETATMTTAALGTQEETP